MWVLVTILFLAVAYLLFLISNLQDAVLTLQEVVSNLQDIISKEIDTCHDFKKEWTIHMLNHDVMDNKNN